MNIDFTKLIARQAQRAQADIDAILATETKADGAIGGRVRGTVRWFDGQLGYGFIDHAGTDVYVHYSQLIMEGYRTLREGQEVEYTPVDTEKGPAAHKVKALR